MLSLRKSPKGRIKPQESGLGKLHAIIAVLSATIVLLIIGTQAPSASPPLVASLPPRKATKEKTSKSVDPGPQYHGLKDILTAEEWEMYKEIVEGPKKNISLAQIQEKIQMAKTLHRKLMVLKIGFLTGHKAINDAVRQREVSSEYAGEQLFRGRENILAIELYIQEIFFLELEFRKVSETRLIGPRVLSLDSQKGAKRNLELMQAQVLLQNIYLIGLVEKLKRGEIINRHKSNASPRKVTAGMMEALQAHRELQHILESDEKNREWGFELYMMGKEIETIPTAVVLP